MTQIATIETPVKVELTSNRPPIDRMPSGCLGPVRLQEATVAGQEVASQVRVLQQGVFR